MTEGESIQSVRGNNENDDGTPQTTPGEPSPPVDDSPIANANQYNVNGDKEEENGGEKEPDILPAPLNALFACLWVLLFGGRWLLVPLLQAVGVLSVEQVADWDTGLLYKTYLVLLFLTCIVLALRAARNAQKPKSTSH